MGLETLPKDERTALHQRAQRDYEALKAAGLSLDLTRGKPSIEQLDLSADLLGLPGADFRGSDGIDTRNYGGLVGLTELRQIFADILNVAVEQIVAADNSSLSMMHDALVFALLSGTPDSPRPWAQENSVKFLCPVPGYDRHFAITEHYGVEMISVPMRSDGPDLVAVREAVADPSVKGMWLVPTYGNPTGAVVSESVAAELAAMATGAPDFRIFWDNAYAVHHLTDERTKTPDILGLGAVSGHVNRTLVFASTSKITFAGSGVSFLAGSAENIDWWKSQIGVRTIGPDKVNHLRHARFLGDAEGVYRLMDQHRALIAPKFEATLAILGERLGPHAVAQWTEPKGGYFISLAVDASAARVVELAREAGIALTPAGLGFPYEVDPDDRYIRLAPTFPSLEDVRTAMDGVATCVLLAAAEKSLGAA